MKRASFVHTVLTIQVLALITACSSNVTSAPLLAKAVGSALTRDGEVAVRSKFVFQEVPVWSDAFVDSIGVNTHLSFLDSPYWSRYETMKSLLTHSGIRHLRDGPMESKNPACNCNPLNDLGRAGVKGDIILSYLSNQNATFVKSFLQQVPTTEAFEDPNEVNVNGDPNWVVDTGNYASTIYPAIKAMDPTLAVVGPSIAWINGGQNTYALLGDLSPFMQFGNIHDYPGGRNPGTLGWGPWFNIPANPNGGASYGSIAASVSVDSSMAGKKPPWATETGYGDATGQTPESINARYEPRLFLEEWLNGVARTYQYQFVDFGSDGFGNFGLVTASMSPKRNYFALTKMISLLADPGTPPISSEINFLIDGANNSVHHLLLGKQDGSLYLAIWIEAEGYNVDTKQLEKVPSQKVSVNFGIPLISAETYVFNDSGSATATSVPVTQAIPLTVTDHLQILKLIRS